jgi:hypothetical protein
MTRRLRVEHPGAFHHLMNRGDRHEPIFFQARAAAHRNQEGWIAARREMRTAGYAASCCARADEKRCAICGTDRFLAFLCCRGTAGSAFFPKLCLLPFFSSGHLPVNAGDR